MAPSLEMTCFRHKSFTRGALRSPIPLQLNLELLSFVIFDARPRMRGPPHKEMTAYGCYFRPDQVHSSPLRGPLIGGRVISRRAVAEFARIRASTTCRLPEFLRIPRHIGSRQTQLYGLSPPSSNGLELL